MKIRLQFYYIKMPVIIFGLLSLTLVISIVYGLFTMIRPKPAANSLDDFEKAVFRHVEFFGAKVKIPIPTAESRENLVKLLKNQPKDAQILQKLAEFEENLGLFAEAEDRLKLISTENPQLLIAFYTRRGDFEKKADLYFQLYKTSTGRERRFYFQNLIQTAERHALDKYLNDDFFLSELQQTDAEFFILSKFIEKLTVSKNHVRALKVVRDYQAKFPNEMLLLKNLEISILIAGNQIDDAQKIYETMFDPFWSAEKRAEFYAFLDRFDRLTSYLTKVRETFRKNPTEFSNALRLADYHRDEFEKVSQIVRQVERERARKKMIWSADELLSAARILLEAGDGATASKFLYTLGREHRLEPQSDLRRRALFQLFEIFSAAEEQKLPLAPGGLETFADIARSDLNPGLTTGLLSLIFNGQNPRKEFENKELIAVRLFNREAAFHLFTEFKTEFPDAPELAQMYLDLIRFYTAAKNPAVAAELLEEFQTKFADFRDYADASIKLAEAFVTAKNSEKEREMYKKALDFLGRRAEPKFPEQIADGKPNESEFFQTRTDGLQIESDSKPVINGFQTDSANFEKVLPDKNFQISLFRPQPSISYSQVLGRLISSLDRERQMDEILRVYADEIAKYPDESALYEQMLSWLGQTNLTEKQLEIYQKALARFPKRDWQDRFARWLIRQKKENEFEEFSQRLIAQFDSAETQDFLKKFADGKESAAPESFDNRFYLALYGLAHQKFPDDLTFTKGLIRYYEQNKMPDERRRLLLENFFTAKELREILLTDLVKTGELDAWLKRAEAIENRSQTEILPYKLFRAQAELRRSRFENAVEIYRELSQSFPFEPEFSETLLLLTRSFGQKNLETLKNSAEIARQMAAQFPADKKIQTTAGELQAELGNFAEAGQLWQNIIAQARGENENYLETATLFWDYFQNDAALETIRRLRAKTGDPNLYAFETGAIFESKNEPEKAFEEYLKAFSDADSKTVHRAKKRLETLFMRGEFTSKIFSAFEKISRSTVEPFPLIYHFADLLFRVNRTDEALKLLKNRLKTERSVENLQIAKQFFHDLKDDSGVRLTLARLIQLSERPRDEIPWHFRLAESYFESGEFEKSSGVLKSLLRKYPKNYGVILKSEEFFRQIGRPSEAIFVLQKAVQIARGQFSAKLRRRLAESFSAAGKLSAAEEVFQLLLRENPGDSEIFEELADIFVQTGKPSALRETFDTAIKELHRRNIEPNRLKFEIIDLRRRMIPAFTKLKDFESATRQYVEIINLAPDDEEIIKEAINYAKRFGGTKILLDYYLKLSDESFKNYRWNVVLAEIYAAENDLTNAAENLRTAISNQPVRLELYESLLEIYLKSANFETALGLIDTMLELSPDDRKYLGQKILILKKLGRFAQADAVKQKLPINDVKKLEKSLQSETFSATDQSDSDELFAANFEQFLEKPFQAELKADNLKRFARIVQNQRSLSEINAKIWKFRQILTSEFVRPDSLQAGQARQTIKVFDSVWPSSFGRIFREKATGEDFQAVEKQIREFFESISTNDLETLAFLEKMTAESGFDELTESFLQTAVLRSVKENRPANVRRLIVFYQQRAEFEKIRELLKNETTDPQLIKMSAENARLLENPDEEFSALENYFNLLNEPLSARFLDLIYEKSRDKMLDPSRFSKPRQLQIMNFLLQKNDLTALRQAIENSAFSGLWKTSRSAEIGLRTETLTAADLENLKNALQIAPIGEMIKSGETGGESFSGDDWFRMTETFGRGLYFSSDTATAQLYLPSLIEQRPRDPQRHAQLGIFYLQRQDFKNALEHFRLADELKPRDAENSVYLGAAYYQLGEPEKAFAVWRQIIENEINALDNAALYLQTLADFGQQNRAREDLRPILMNVLKKLDEAPEIEKDAENLRKFLHKLSDSFSDESQKAVYFEQLCRQLKGNSRLPQMLVDESFIADAKKPVFYRILMENVERAENSGFDDEYSGILNRVWNREDAEILLEHENDFQIVEPESELLNIQKQFLDFLIAQKNFDSAQNLIGEIERTLEGRFARPEWLRLSKIKVLANGKNPSNLADLIQNFVGLKTPPNVSQPALPNWERFLAVRQILLDQRQAVVLAEFEENFYARSLALQDYEPANFSGLADKLFGNGKRREALELLNIFVELAETENHGDALKRLAELPSIAKFYPTGFEIKNDSAPKFEIVTALQVAVDQAEKHQEFETAIDFRVKLLNRAPADNSNKILVAGLANRRNMFEKTLRLYFEIISDRGATRLERWSAIWSLGQTLAADESKWSKAKAELNEFTVDEEMKTALETIYRLNLSRPEEALEIINAAKLTTPPLIFLRALAEKGLDRNDTARRSFSSVTAFETELQSIFGQAELSPNAQITELFLTDGKPRAAVEWAVKSNIHEQTYQANDPQKRLFDLLSKLSGAAENFGLFPEALKFENARLQFLRLPEEKVGCQTRLELLENSAAKKKLPAQNPFLTDNFFTE